jgi:hypothetical protein
MLAILFSPDWQSVNHHFAPACNGRQSSGDELFRPGDLCLSQVATPVAILDAGEPAQPLFAGLVFV